MADREEHSLEKRKQYRLTKRSFLAQLVASSFDNLVRWSALVALCWILARMIGALGGKTTIAEIGISLETDFKVSETVALIFMGSFGAYALHRMARRRKSWIRFKEKGHRKKSQQTARANDGLED